MTPLSSIVVPVSPVVITVSLVVVSSLSLLFVLASTIFVLLGPSLGFGIPSVGFRVFFQTPNEWERNRLDMEKVTKATALTSHLVIVATTGFAKIGHGRKLGLNGPAVVESSIHDLQGVTRLFFIKVFDINVPNHMISEIICHVDTFHPAEFSELHVQVLKKAEEILERLLFVDSSRGPRRLLDFCLAYRVLKEVPEEQRLRKGRLVVQTRATVAVPTGTNLEVERTVYLCIIPAAEGGNE
jgi:hypothetical protein